MIPPHPQFALSVRQPWAWAILHAGKDTENRDWRHPNPGLKFRGRVAIHAASGMTQHEYLNAADFIDTTASHVRCPPPHELVRGAIIGSVDVVDVVRYRGPATAEQLQSPWFVGPVGLILRDPVACEPIPCKGALGFFRWLPAEPSAIPPPARWMLPSTPGAVIDPQRSLL